MFEHLLPQPIDNDYRGHTAGLWLFGLVITVKTLQSLLVLVAGAWVVPSADGVPLDTFPVAAAQTVLAVWAQLGIARLILSVLGILVLVRYRSAVALMFALLALQYLAGQLAFQLIPLLRTGSPPGPIANAILFALMLVGLVLALRKQDAPRVSGAGAT